MNIIGGLRNGDNVIKMQSVESLVPDGSSNTAMYAEKHVPADLYTDPNHPTAHIWERNLRRRLLNHAFKFWRSVPRQHHHGASGL